MKRGIALLILFCFPALSGYAFAESEIESRVQALEATLKKQEEMIKMQQKVIENLKAEVRQMRPTPKPEGVAAEQTTPAGEIQQQVQELKEKIQQVAEAQTRTSPGIFNPAIGLVGETVFGYRDKGSTQTGSDRPGGFDIFQRSLELTASASIDPFAKGYAVINASVDPITGEATLGVEEAALQTTSLPWNLELKAGRFFGEFGRLGYIHDHELPFVNRPLALAQYIGGESRTDGLQLNWLLPVDHYVSLTVGAGNQFGGDNPPNSVGDFRNGSGLNYWGRLSTFFNLTPNISFEPGISGLWNPKTDAQWADPGGANPPFPIVAGNTFTERERRLWGIDWVVSYKPLRNNQFESLTWGTEVLFSDNSYDVTDSSGNTFTGRSVSSVGLYSYLTYKFHRQWSTGFLFEYVENQVNNQDKTYAYSPYVTWALSHWNQLRLQYTHTDPNAGSGRLTDNAVYLQWAWIIGSHSHGWQQR
jgi:hypothetical protein